MIAFQLIFFYLQLVIKNANEIPLSIIINEPVSDDDTEEEAEARTPAEESLPTIFKYERLLGENDVKTVEVSQKRECSLCSFL